MIINLNYILKKLKLMRMIHTKRTLELHDMIIVVMAISHDEKKYYL